jgi:hypothetical protein
MPVQQVLEFVRSCSLVPFINTLLLAIATNFSTTPARRFHAMNAVAPLILGHLTKIVI